MNRVGFAQRVQRESARNNGDSDSADSFDYHRVGADQEHGVYCGECCEHSPHESERSMAGPADLGGIEADQKAHGCGSQSERDDDDGRLSAQQCWTDQSEEQQPGGEGKGRDWSLPKTPADVADGGLNDLDRIGRR